MLKKIKNKQKQIVLSTVLTMAISMVPNSVTALAAGNDSVSNGATNISIDSKDSSNDVDVSVDDESLPSGFTDSSIGSDNDNKTSSFDFKNKTFTVNGSGNFIGKDPNSTDSYEFINYKVEGDATITARLSDFDMTNAQYGQAGVFMRSDNATDSADYFGVYWDNKANQYRYAYRDNASGKTGAAAISGLTGDSKDLYIKITKEGNTFRYYISSDPSFSEGNTYTNSQYIECSDNTWYSGLVVSNGGSESPAVATFDNVKIESPSKVYYDSSLDKQLLDTVENVNAVSSDSKVTLSWNSVDGAKSYIIKRSTDPSGEFTDVKTVNSSSTSYVDSDVTNFTTYYYKVVATNDEGKSNDSQVIMAMPNNSNPLNLQYEENAAVFNMTEEPNDTVLSSDIKIAGSTNKSGTITIKQDGNEVYSGKKAANESFQQSFNLKEGRNTIEIYQTTDDNKTTLKTYNIVYLKQNSYNIVVDGSYTGDDGNLVNNKATFKTIQAAVDSVSKKNTERVTILVKNGVYKEKATVETPYISIIGEDSEKTVWTYDAANGTIDPSTGSKYGTSGSASVTIKKKAVGFTAENITIENAFKEKGDENEQAVALNNQADQSIFVNCRFIANQDTLLADASSSSPARQYYYGCYIEGDVDFIFGRAQAVFDNCEIASFNRNSTYNNGYVTAADTWDRDSYGYLIINSRLVGLDNIADNTVSLGRPWRPSSQTDKMTPAVAYVNCYMGSHITSKGWDDMTPTSLASTSDFYEFGSYGPGAKLSSTRSVLTLNQSKNYTMENVFAKDSAVKSDGENGYANDWNPTSSTDAISMNSLYIQNQDEDEVIGVESIKLNEENVTLEIGESKELKATISPENATNKDMSFSSSNESVANVDANGVITAIGAGEATITVKAGEKTATCVVKVNEEVNNAPVIEASDVTINEGDTFNPYVNISASDVEDGDITSSVTIKENNVDTTKPGEYKVVYEIKDSKGASVTKEIKVTVKEVINNAPVIEASDVTINEGDTFVPYANVVASDVEDGDITSSISIKENNVNTAKPGEYKVVYEVKDSKGASVTKEIKVTVNAKSQDESKLTISELRSKTSKVTGNGISGSTVKVYINGKEIGSATVSSKGTYSIKIAKQNPGTTIEVKMINKDNSTISKSVVVTDKFKKFKVNSIKASNTSIGGVGTPGALVKAYIGDEVIGSGVVDSSGNYKINITQQKQGVNVKVEMSLLGYETVAKDISVKK